jgi:hypothetical protein
MAKLHKFLPILILLCAARCRASIGLVVGEPFGSFGTMLPAGHAGVFLDHICAETPTHLRPCQPGEHGVIVSRYHDLQATHTDWLAIPGATFLYGAEDPANIPTFVTAQSEADIRESYRQDHLLGVVPNRFDKRGMPLPPRDGDWAEGIGAAFDRRLFLYVIDTTPAQDAMILAFLNDRPNNRRYTFLHANCADFAETLLNLVVGGTLHPTRLNDFDITGPKSLARQLDAYGHKHPSLHLRVYEVPQIPGTLRRSRPMRSCSEGFLKTKRYLVTLLLIQPEFVLADWSIYEAKGKWTPGLDAATLTPPSAVAALSPDPKTF